MIQYIFKKIDVIQEGMSTLKVEIDIYAKYMEKII